MEEGQLAALTIAFKDQLAGPSYFKDELARPSSFKVELVPPSSSKEARLGPPSYSRGRSCQRRSEGGSYAPARSDGKAGKAEFQRYPELARGAAFLARSRLLLSVAPNGKYGKERFSALFWTFWRF